MYKVTDLSIFFFIAVLTTNEKLESPVYRFKSKDTTYIHLKTKAFTFHNPWTKEVETIVTTNTVVP